MPRDSFHSMQEGWKREIQGLFDELRAKEKVRGGRATLASRSSAGAGPQLTAASPSAPRPDRRNC